MTKMFLFGAHFGGAAPSKNFERHHACVHRRVFFINNADIEELFRGKHTRVHISNVQSPLPSGFRSRPAFDSFRSITIVQGGEGGWLDL